MKLRDITITVYVDKAGDFVLPAELVELLVARRVSTRDQIQDASLGRHRRRDALRDLVELAYDGAHDAEGSQHDRARYSTAAHMLIPETGIFAVTGSRPFTWTDPE